MLSFKRMRQQSRPIHCKHLSLIESTTARVTLRDFVPKILAMIVNNFGIDCRSRGLRLSEHFQKKRGESILTTLYIRQQNFSWKETLLF